MSAAHDGTLGLEICVRDPPPSLRGARFGLLMNRASVDRDLRLACDLLRADSFPGRLAALFTPQHGLFGDAQANMVESAHEWHAEYRLPIHSLYSETRRPTTEMLAELDALVVDLPDVGTRVYTYAWTVQQCLEACADAGVRVVVLDRPNPLGGMQVEGPRLNPAYRSFVGGAAIPMRHGLTLGELTRLVNAEREQPADLEIVPLENWSPDQLFPATGRHWLAPSPNLPRFESALVYPGQVLLEGTNVSEGRGTTTPFEIAGAPFVEAERLCRALESRELPGIVFLPIRFRPTFDKWAGQVCGGVSLHVTDPQLFRPYSTSIRLLAEIRRFWPRDFAWLPPPYEYETVLPPIDILSGSPQLRETLDRIEDVDDQELETLWQPDPQWWEHTRDALVYPRDWSTEPNSS